MRALALMVVLLAPKVWAQENAEPSAPPLVQAPEAPSDEVVPPPPAVTTPQVGRIANAPLDPVPDAAAQQAEPPGRAKRIGWSFGFGVVSGAAVAAVGGLIGANVHGAQAQPIGNGWWGAALGFMVGAPIGVLVAGLLFDGTGAWWATLVGDVAGAAIALAAIGFGGPEGTVAAFTLPLIGSVIGYEVTSVANRTVVTPTVSVLRGGGGSVGVMGQF
jgi:hypothetical protein